MKQKTPSARLRATLWVLYDKQGVTQDFDEWYAEKIEHFIKAVKRKIKEYDTDKTD